MSSAEAKSKPKVIVEATIIRKDGSTENLGVVATSETSPEVVEKLVNKIKSEGGN